MKQYQDLPGKAIWDYYQKTIVEPLFVHDEFGPRVEMPVEAYFREYDEMPELEQIALNLCKGNILDIGAGAGSHVLFLQNKGENAAAIEISPNSCATMKERGIKNIYQKDIFQFSEGKYDTLLMLMNGIGLCGNINRLKELLIHAKKLIKPNGQIIFDSCDIEYMYEETKKPKHYYGEVRCKYSYGNVQTDWFQWLYIDKDTLHEKAEETGWKSQILAEDENNQYLVRLYLS